MKKITFLATLIILAGLYSFTTFSNQKNVNNTTKINSTSKATLLADTSVNITLSSFDYDGTVTFTHVATGTSFTHSITAGNAITFPILIQPGIYNYYQMTYNQDGTSTTYVSVNNPHGIRRWYFTGASYTTDDYNFWLHGAPWLVKVRKTFDGVTPW